MKEIFRSSLKTSQSLFGFLKKALLVFIVFFTVISAFYYMTDSTPQLKGISIQQQLRKQTYETISTLQKDNTNLGKMRLLTYTGLMCSTLGEACTQNPDDGIINSQKSIVGKVSGLLVVPYSRPPASSLVWIDTSLQNAGFIPKTYAAEGIGFASIKGYLVIWKLFRNLSYMLLVLVMVSIGFMIMFRVKLDAQTAMSLESALPRIVIALLLITFSFALSGFLIDVMYVIITLLISIFYRIGIDPYTPANMGAAQNTYLAATFINLWPIDMGNLFSVGYAFWDLIPIGIRVAFSTLISVPVSIGFGELISSFFVSPATTGVANWSVAGFSWGFASKWIDLIFNVIVFGTLSFFLPGILITLILLLTVLLHVFRIFFIILNSYLKICLYIIFSPFILMFTAIPGNGSFEWWIKNLFGELIVFPTVVTIMITGHIMLIVNNIPAANGVDTTFRLPFMYGFDANAFNAIVALGLILLIPDFIKFMQGIVGVQDSPFKLGFGTFFAGAGVFSGGLSSIDTIENFKSTLVGRDYQKPRGFLDLVGAHGFAERIRNMGKSP